MKHSSWRLLLTITVSAELTHTENLVFQSAEGGTDQSRLRLFSSPVKPCFMYDLVIEAAARITAVRMC